MKKKLVWRLSSLPEIEELTSLVKAKILTEEEAKDIILKEVDEEKEIPSDQLKEIKEEIKFLRGIILELSKKEPTVIYKYLYDHTKDWTPVPNRPWWGRDYYVTCANLSKDNGNITAYNAMSMKCENAGININ